jgi:hypothetical protein
MKTNYTYLLFLLLISLLCLSADSFGQCPIKFDYSVEKSVKNTSGGKIYLTLTEGSPAFEFRLFDLYQDKVVQVKSISSMKMGEKTLVFQNLPASSYLIHVYTKNCDKPITLGKLSGIVVDTNGQ